MFSTFLRLFFLEYLHCFHIRAHYCWVDNVDKGAAGTNKMFDFSFLIRCRNENELKTIWARNHNLHLEIRKRKL